MTLVAGLKVMRFEVLSSERCKLYRPYTLAPHNLITNEDEFAKIQ